MNNFKHLFILLKYHQNNSYLKSQIFLKYPWLSASSVPPSSSNEIVHWRGAIVGQIGVATIVSILLLKEKPSNDQNISRQRGINWRLLLIKERLKVVNNHQLGLYDLPVRKEVMVWRSTTLLSEERRCYKDVKFIFEVINKVFLF